MSIKEGEIIISKYLVDFCGHSLPKHGRIYVLFREALSLKEKLWNPNFQAFCGKRWKDWPSQISSKIKWSRKYWGNKCSMTYMPFLQVSFLQDMVYFMARFPLFLEFFSWPQNISKIIRKLQKSTKRKVKIICNSTT